jgi:hypothetical protein
MSIRKSMAGLNDSNISILLSFLALCLFLFAITAFAFRPRSILGPGDCS